MSLQAFATVECSLFPSWSPNKGARPTCTCITVQQTAFSLQAGTYRDDGGGYLLGGIDNLPDARHSQGDIHGSHTGKVEGLQSHLSPRLSYALSPKGPNRGPCMCGSDGHVVDILLIPTS